jgi:hypothetical protein
MPTHKLCLPTAGASQTTNNHQHAKHVSSLIDLQNVDLSVKVMSLASNVCDPVLDFCALADPARYAHVSNQTATK